MIKWIDSIGFSPRERFILDRWRDACASISPQCKENWVMGVGRISDFIPHAHPEQLKSLSEGVRYFESQAFKKMAGREMFVANTVLPNHFSCGLFGKHISSDICKGSFTGSLDASSMGEVFSICNDPLLGEQNGYSWLIQEKVNLGPEARVVVTPVSKTIDKEGRGYSQDLHDSLFGGFIGECLDEHAKETGCGYFIADFARKDGGDHICVEINPFINFWPFGCDPMVFLKDLE